MGLADYFEARDMDRTYCRDPHEPNEAALFHYTYRQARPRCEWVALFDLDEYLTLQPEVAGREGGLHSFLDAWAWPVIKLPWVMMGGDGHWTRPPGLIVENYLLLWRGSQARAPLGALAQILLKLTATQKNEQSLTGL